MATQIIEKKKRVPAKSRWLLSRSTILILSGILIGMGIGNGWTASIHKLGFSAGMVGLVSYLGLDTVSRRRREKEEERALHQASCKLDTRIFRHIARTTIVTQPQQPENRSQRDLSFLTVASPKDRRKS